MVQFLIGQTFYRGTTKGRLINNGEFPENDLQIGDSVKIVSDIDSENGEFPEKDFQIGDSVKIVTGLFQGYYATILGRSYGDELEIQYFEEKYGKWILKGHIDSRSPEEMVKVTATVDGRSRYTFSML